MGRTQYYEDLKQHARQVRADFGFTTPCVRRSDLQKIYREYEIKFDLWPKPGAPRTARFKQLRGAFFWDELGATIMVSRDLPDEPAIFTMAHELKHFLFDRDLGQVICFENNQNEAIEIGAEIFAAELMFPDQDFAALMLRMGIEEGRCTPEILVRLKHNQKATLSYAALTKKAKFLGFANSQAFGGVKWRQLEEQLLGEPVYKKFQRHRRNLG